MGEGVTPGGHGGILRQRRAETQGPSQQHILEKEGRYQRDRRGMVPAGTPTYLSGFAVLKCPVSKRPVSKQKDNEEIRY
jgi:hypothetical protein